MSVRDALLALIGERPRAVAELRRDFEERTRGTWPINIGQVYQTVRRLERDRLVVKRDEPGGGDAGDDGDARSADVYEITDDGRAEVRRWFAGPTLRPRDERDALVMRIAVAAALPGEDVDAILASQRAAAIAEMRDIIRERSRTPRDRGADRLLLERRIFELEAEARWLDHVETLAAPGAADENGGRR